MLVCELQVEVVLISDFEKKQISDDLKSVIDFIGYACDNILNKKLIIDYPFDYPFEAVVIGYIELCLKNLRGIRFGFHDENTPVLMNCSRVIIEMMMNIGYIMEDESKINYLAILMLKEHEYRVKSIMEGIERNITFFGGDKTEEWQSKFKRTYDALHEKIKEIDEKIKKIDLNGESARRWIRHDGYKGTSLKQKAEKANLLGFYESIYSASSGYLHADGYGVIDQYRYRRSNHIGAVYLSLVASLDILEVSFRRAVDYGIRNESLYTDLVRLRGLIENNYKKCMSL